MFHFGGFYIYERPNVICIFEEIIDILKKFVVWRRSKFGEISLSLHATANRVVHWKMIITLYFLRINIRVINVRLSK